MNKMLIVLLAVCLVSTHAFVKRDAPAPSAPSSDLRTNMEEVRTAIVGFSKTVGEKVSKAFEDAPETLKKGLNDMYDSAKETLEKFKPAGDAKPAGDTKPAAA